MSPELSKKERIAQKRQALTTDLYMVFVHSYEMDRAWRLPQRKAFERALKALNIKVNFLIKEKPQESSFIIGCRGDAKELVIKRVAELEGQVIKNGQVKR